VVEIGKANIVRQGTDVTVVALSRMVNVALAAADILDKEGISIEILDPRTISPLDEKTILDSVRKTERLVVVDEDHPRCSMATDIIALVATKAFEYLDAPAQMVTPPHTPVPFSPVLEKFYVPDAQRIVKAVMAVVPQKR